MSDKTSIKEIQARIKKAMRLQDPKVQFDTLLACMELYAMVLDVGDRIVVVRY
jgi:cephalosporin hydroxylase